MGTIQQKGAKPQSFIKLKTMDKDCRCCGKGTQYVCDSCNKLLTEGHAFFIEVKDNSNEVHKKPTGYAIAFNAKHAYEHGQPDVTLTAGIYFIRESDLKTFLGDGYNKLPHRGNHPAGRFLSGPRWNNTNRQAADSPRSVTELAHR